MKLLLFEIILFLTLHHVTSVDDFENTDYVTAYLVKWQLGLHTLYKVKVSYFKPSIDIEISNGFRKETFTVELDSGSRDIWIINDTFILDGNATSKGFRIPKYKPTKRLTDFPPGYIEYCDGGLVKGEWAYDTMNLKQSKKFEGNMYFVAANSIDHILDVKTSEISGFIGLAGFQDISSQKPSLRERNFVLNLNQLKPATK